MWQADSSLGSMVHLVESTAEDDRGKRITLLKAGWSFDCL